MTAKFCACNCGASLAGMRSDAVYASEACRKRAERAANPDKARTPHPLAEVRAEQEQIAAKARWTLIVREHIARTLLETGFVHSDDLDSLGIPDEHRNIAGSQMGGFVQRGLMAEVGRRASTKPSRKKAKSAIYRITDKGRQELTIGVSTEGDESPSSNAPFSAHSGGQTAGVGAGFPPGRGQGVSSRSGTVDTRVACPDPGESTAHREGTPQSKDAARHPMPVPSASSPSGGSGATPLAPEPARLFELPPECPGHDRIAEAA